MQALSLKTQMVFWNLTAKYGILQVKPIYVLTDKIYQY